jgi:hypothetical protein
MQYSLPFNNISTGAVADTFKSIAALIVANTVGHRARIRKLTVGFADDAPADRNVSIRLHRTNNATAGTAGSTITTAAMPKKDSNSIDSLMSAGLNYSAEPTTFETHPVWQDELNDRNGLVVEWDEEQAPKVTQNQTMGFTAAPRAAFASILSGTVEFEIY